jgi:hypothetical protein
MTDAIAQGPAPAPDPYDARWELGVEARLNRLTIISYAEGGIAVVALGLAFVGFRAINNLAKNLNALAEVTQGISNTIWPQPIEGTVQQRPPQGTDETIRMGDDVSKGASGPGTGEASDEVKGLIASDPISPKDLARADGLVEPLRFNPHQDLPPGQQPYGGN